MTQQQPVKAPAASSLQPAMSMGQVAQLLQDMSSIRPTEQALQNDNRRLTSEVASLQAQLRQANINAEDTFKNWTANQKSLCDAYTALKRGTFIKDVMSVYHEYVPTSMVLGSEEHKGKIIQLALDVTAIHDNALSTGVGGEIITEDFAKSLYCNDADKEWLLECLQEDMTTHYPDGWI